MSLPLLAILFLGVLALAYRLYGGWVARQFKLDDSKPTPATTINDGLDFVPVKWYYLFPQHFSAIAAAGPIAGPILACQSFGWLPCLLWIGFGVVLIGAVHDFSSLTASVRHGARSIADIVRQHMGYKAGTAMMLFIWITLIYVIVAFTQITAASFVTAPEELQGIVTKFHPGGAVAAAGTMYLALSMIMGLVQRFLKPPLWLLTIIFVPATLGVVWLGTLIANSFIMDIRVWGLLILIYCSLASVAPAWLILQPRGYLGGFILFLALGLGVIGIFAGGYEIKQTMFTSWSIGGKTGSLFPFLFVTIACGACSGFHGLVCSGTTSKQIEKESHIHKVGYGAMLAEGFVAFIALVTIMILSPDQQKGMNPATIYGNGIGHFLTLIIGEQNLPFAITFGAMAFSTFVFDTLDVCARLGRYIIQEFIGKPGIGWGWLSTLATIALPVFFVLTSDQNGWRLFWTLFGAANQLLAALTLLAITMWLYQARQRIAFTLLPMIFVLTITLWSLTQLGLADLTTGTPTAGSIINGIAAALLISLALFLAIRALVMVMRKGGGKQTATT